MLSTRMGSRPFSWNSSGLLLCLLSLLLLGSEVLGRQVAEVGARNDAALRPEGQAVSSNKAASQLSGPWRQRRDANWNYDKSTESSSGVYSWAKLFPSCGGSSQSPVDLLASKTTYDQALERFTFQPIDTHQNDNFTITNNGHTVQVDCTACSKMQISGGSLGATYQLKQIHWHWGSQDSRGSEHTVSSKAYPMEMHVVYVNTKYAKETTLSNSDSLAVLGFLYKISDKTENSALQKIVNVLPSVRGAGHSVQLNVTLTDLMLLMGPTDHYYRYNGSLTTPHCNEIVTWTVFKDPILISMSQMTAFRRLMDSHNHLLVDNFRPVQDLHMRRLKANFRPEVPPTEVGSVLSPSAGVIYFVIYVTLFEVLLPA